MCVLPKGERAVYGLAMAQILIIGGSGRTGLHLLEQAPQRGHAVRALVRKPEAVKAPLGVELVKGTPEKLEDLREAMKGTEAVIVAHNNSRASDNPRGEADQLAEVHDGRGAKHPRRDGRAAREARRLHLRDRRR